MAIIDLTIDRPAWKRVEQKATETEEPSAEEMEIESKMDEESETESAGGMFSMRRLLLVAGMAAFAALAVRRIRGMMGSETEAETPIDVETPAEATAE